MTITEKIKKSLGDSAGSNEVEKNGEEQIRIKKNR